MTYYSLQLTEEQAEILGFALSRAKREQEDRAETASVDWVKAENLERARRIEDIRCLLDAAPLLGPTADDQRNARLIA